MDVCRFRSQSTRHYPFKKVEKIIIVPLIVSTFRIINREAANTQFEAVKINAQSIAEELKAFHAQVRIKIPSEIHISNYNSNSNTFPRRLLIFFFDSTVYIHPWPIICYY